MHIEPSLADALPRVLRSIPSAAKVSAGVKNQSERVIQAVRRDSKTSQNEATGGKQGESLPFIVLMGEGLVLSRSVFRPFHRDPLPERNGSRTRLLFDERLPSTSFTTTRELPTCAAGCRRRLSRRPRPSGVRNPPCPRRQPAKRGPPAGGPHQGPGWRSRAFAGFR